MPAGSGISGRDVIGASRFTLSPCGRGWLREAKPGEGFSPRVNLSVECAERTPHPALRATFSHKGRREESKKSKKA
jgi:hypothetical protein